MQYRRFCKHVLEAVEGNQIAEVALPTDLAIRQKASKKAAKEKMQSEGATAEEIKAKYESTGVAYAWYPIEGAGHGPWGAKIEGKSLSVLAFDFIVAKQGLEMD